MNGRSQGQEVGTSGSHDCVGNCSSCLSSADRMGQVCNEEGDKSDKELLCN